MMWLLASLGGKLWMGMVTMYTPSVDDGAGSVGSPDWNGLVSAERTE